MFFRYDSLKARAKRLEDWIRRVLNEADNILEVDWNRIARAEWLIDELHRKAYLV